MANTFFWIDLTGVMGWDDVVLGFTGWSLSSGGSAATISPGNGDTAIFDVNSGSVGIASGPVSPIALQQLDNSAAAFDLDSAKTISITVTLSLSIAGNTYFNGILGNNVTATLAGTSTLGGTIGDNCTVNLNANSSLQSIIVGNGNIFNFNNSAINTCTIGNSFNTFNFTQTSQNQAAIVDALAVSFKDNATNTATFNAATVTIDGTGTIFIGPNGFTATTLVVAADVLMKGDYTINVSNATLQDTCIIGDNGTLTQIDGGTILIKDSAQTLATYSALNGTVTINGSSAVNRAPITGDANIVSGGKNYGAVSGTLTAPYSTSAGAWGSWGTLAITGLPSSGGGGGPLGGPYLQF